MKRVGTVLAAVATTALQDIGSQGMSEQLGASSD